MGLFSGPFPSKSASSTNQVRNLGGSLGALSPYPVICCPRVLSVLPETLLRSALPSASSYGLAEPLLRPATQTPHVLQVPTSSSFLPLTHPLPPSPADARIIFVKEFIGTHPCLRTSNLRNCLWDKSEVKKQSPLQLKHSSFQAPSDTACPLSSALTTLRRVLSSLLPFDKAALFALPLAQSPRVTWCLPWEICLFPSQPLGRINLFLFCELITLYSLQMVYQFSCHDLG